MMTILELTDDELLRAVNALRAMGYISESGFYAEVIKCTKGEPADLSLSTNPVAERFFVAAVERQLEATA